TYLFLPQVGQHLTLSRLRRSCHPASNNPLSFLRFRGFNAFTIKVSQALSPRQVFLLTTVSDDRLRCAIAVYAARWDVL
ncbi:hypothetical protein QUB75_27240, partial [Microcoleus sp. K1-B6]|uniref:hypothetical protein n=1 Tax=unclassified Microcoleus TaxID=2642155 RepID=UPI002FD48FE0